MLVKWIWDWNGKDPEVEKERADWEENISEKQKSLTKIAFRTISIMLPRNQISFPTGPVGCSAKVLSRVPSARVWWD